MATFQVPQFIDQKPKIVGPLTLVQFFYLAVAAAISFASFYIFNLFLWFLVTAIVGVVGIAFAFGKVNGQEMIKVAQAALGYVLKPRVYTWQRATSNTSFSTNDVYEVKEMRKNMGFQQKLKTIVLNVTTSKSSSGKNIRDNKNMAGYETATFATGEKRKVKRVDFNE